MQLFVHTASHPGVSETLKHAHWSSDWNALCVIGLWHPLSLLHSPPRSRIFAGDDGRVAAWHPDAKPAAWCWCVPSTHTPLLTWLFFQPSMPCLLCDAVGSHTLPHLNDWSAIERFHPYLLRPIHVGGSRIASMPSARFFVLACLSFLLPHIAFSHWLKRTLARPSLLYLRCPSLLHLPPGKTAQLKCHHMYCDPSCIACRCRLQDLAGKVLFKAFKRSCGAKFIEN